MNIAWRPLSTWPANRPATPRHQRKGPYAFKASLPQTLDDLEHELEMINARDVAVEIDVEPRDLRLNGEPRASMSTRNTPGVVLHFVDRKGQTITMPCDRYDTWQANVRALFLTLQALRAVDRYGATASGEQYRGWTALPATTTPAFTVDQSAALLGRLAGVDPAVIKASVDVARDAYRRAAAATHPDGGGSTGNFQNVQEGRRVLGAHFGVQL
jgi:hypothetical protein